ncbi:Permease [Candidatus Magnetomoraceae bacterium gMMP-1]
MNFIINVFIETWNLLLEAAIYIIFGILISGLLKIFLNPSTVSKHLGTDRFSSVFKAAIFGIPIPLCSCGVLPAAAALKKQGANKGATTAFLISTPESGVDSIAITYALLDPIMTIARPAAAFLTAISAGIAQNLIHYENDEDHPELNNCTAHKCCNGIKCQSDNHAHKDSFAEKLKQGLKFAVFELWDDLAVWFMIGLLLGGLITYLIPEEIMANYLGGGLASMLIMLAVGIPLYICATASTPIAAALILKGVSPGAVLVFLLVGPATNAASLTVLFGILGKRSTFIYLMTIALFSVICGLILDQIYTGFGLSARAAAGQAAQIIPFSFQLIGSLILLIMSVKPIYRKFKKKIR